MAYSINTNVASLQAQEYLRVSSEFQQKTINRVTSGLRIINSGDDAAGLAIANGFRSDRAVIGQGVRNANDGLSTLQTIDGGINNISQLLDRARTLAAQSASGTFSGDRTVLDSEFQTVLEEIDRQSQSIGLNTGGIFAKNLNVFIGGGRGADNAETISNGSVAIDLSTSTVDTRSLSLKGLQVTGAAATDIDEILADTTNTNSESVSGYTDFYFRGAGFSDDNRLRVQVNLTGVDDANKLVTAINGAIESAGAGGSGASAAFKAAGITASIVKNSAGTDQVVFKSSTAAFQVAAGDRLSNAVLGNVASGTQTGESLDYIVNGAAVTSTSTSTTDFAAAGNVIVRVQGGSLASAADITLAVTTSTTTAEALSSLSSLVANNSSLVAAGISVTASSVGSAVGFTSKRGENFEVLAVGDTKNRLGLGSAQFTAGTDSTSFDVSSITSAAIAASTSSATTQALAFSVGGGAYVTGSFTQGTTTSVSTLVSDLNTFFAQNASLQQAGLVASTAAGGAIAVTSNNGSFFRVNVNSVSGAGNLGFGTLAGTSGTTTVSGSSATSSAAVSSGGAYSSGQLAFAALRGGDDDQTVTLSLKDSSGTQQSLAVTLQADSTATHGRSIDEAIDYINTQIQTSSSADLRKIVAVKERDEANGGAERIVFLSPSSSFKVSVGSTPGADGLFAGTGTTQGELVTSSLLSGGANVGIGSQSDAEAAVNALAAAVANLGKVQAVVGRGQNQFNYAINLAQTQLTNLAASESRIRDADLAAEAANLTKAQILQQAGIAALSQANSAPQAVLSLLRG
ncbi:MAG: flagellin [Acidobacteriota bacterium]